MYVHIADFTDELGRRMNIAMRFKHILALITFLCSDVFMVIPLHDMRQMGQRCFNAYFKMTLEQSTTFWVHMHR